MSPGNSILWAYIETEQWLLPDPYPFMPPVVAIDMNLPSSFLWSSLGKAHERKGDYDSAFKLYETAIIVYEKALQIRSNALMWRYSGKHESVDVFGSVGSDADLVRSRNF